MGLVVQSQVAAKAAGVCFTCDPTGRDHAVVIEAVAGLGDRMVSGQVEPERFRVLRFLVGVRRVLLVYSLSLTHLLSRRGILS